MGLQSLTRSALVYDFKLEARGCVGGAVNNAAETAELLLSMAKLAELTPLAGHPLKTDSGYNNQSTLEFCV